MKKFLYLFGAFNIALLVMVVIIFLNVKDSFYVKEDTVTLTETDNVSADKTEILHPLDKTEVNQGTSYYYDKLCTNDQYVYRALYTVLVNYDKDVTLTKAISEDRLSNIYNCVLKDNPEIFYTVGYSFAKATQSGETSYTIAPTYKYDKDAVKAIKKAIDASVDKVLLDIDELSSDYEKLYYIYNYIIDNTTYVETSNSQYIDSVFLDKKSVCNGYTKALQYLCDKADIYCIYVSGSSRDDGTAHAWNIVKVDGIPYYIDVTWGDVDNDFAVPNFTYFLVTTEFINKTHVIDNIENLPKCSDTTYNYFRRENLYMETFDSKYINNVLKESDAVTFMCASEDLYKQYLKYLITDGNVFKGSKFGEDKISYSVDDIYYIITIIK